MNKRFKRGALGLAALIALVVVLTGCTAKAYASQCAFIVGNGVGDSRDVKQVLLPGEKVSKGDDEDFYVPCNGRNFVVTPDTNHGDRHNAVVATTGASADGKTPGTEMKVWISVYWTLNENRDVLKQFYNNRCRKFACAGTEPSDESGSANFTPTAGWNGMLNETQSPALDRTGNDVMRQFDPAIWREPAKWNGGEGSVAQAFQDAYAAELRVSSQSGNVNYFCGDSLPAGDGKTATCTPMTFTVERVEPNDPAIVTLYNQGVILDQRAAQARAAAGANKARLDAATALYGSREQAGAALREQDAIAACSQSKTTCVVNLGGGSVSVPTPR